MRFAPSSDRHLVLYTETCQAAKLTEFHQIACSLTTKAFADKASE